MASDLPQVAQLVSAAKPGARAKVRIRFRKAGTLRLVSHRDLMKCFERALRRAGLPVHRTQGFHPLPRIVFALSLGLGIAGLCEVVELELDDVIAPDEIQGRLARQMPAGLEILSVNSIAVKVSAQVRRAGYRLEVPSERRADLAEQIAALLAAPACWIERTRPQPRRFDLRPYLSELCLNDQQLHMIMWVTPQGTARPAEVLQALGLADLLETGATLERDLLEIYDEIPHSGPVPEVLPATALPTRPQGDLPAPARPTALVAGPMTFDS
jgi:radical SAM-linked protein